MGSRVWNMKTVLKTRLESLEQKLHDQQEIIDKKFEHEKLTIKAFEEKEAEEVTKLKKENSDNISRAEKNPNIKKYCILLDIFIKENLLNALFINKQLKHFSKNISCHEQFYSSSSEHL